MARVKKIAVPKAAKKIVEKIEKVEKTPVAQEDVVVNLATKRRRA